MVIIAFGIDCTGGHHRSVYIVNRLVTPHSETRVDLYTGGVVICNDCPKV